MDKFKIKSSFIDSSLEVSNKDSWRTIFSSSDIVKETEKAIFLHNDDTDETKWIPKKCIKSADVISDTKVLDELEEMPKEVKERFEKCKKCGCYNEDRCSMYNSKVCYALILCLANDLAEKDKELSYYMRKLEESSN